MPETVRKRSIYVGLWSAIVAAYVQAPLSIYRMIRVTAMFLSRKTSMTENPRASREVPSVGLNRMLIGSDGPLGAARAAAIGSQRVRLKRLCRAFFLGSCMLTTVHAAEWRLGIVPDVPGGKFSSLKLDRYGNAHVVHMDGFDTMLRYSFWDRALNKWFSTNLERGPGFCSLALDSKQRPHISYPAGTGVVHMYWDGEKWQKQFADVHAIVIDYYTSIVLDPKDNPIISFYEERGSGDYVGRLRVVVWNGSYWDLKTVDPDIGSGKFNSMAMDSHGYPEIAIGNVEYQNVSLRYARWDGQTWNVEILGQH